ncbi:MAG: TetR/AcrR family transcriptional regulator [Clostridiales bacterium]|nr:TetR/AcrR family transcriptional regulator [Clostridiales bacterium]
MFDIDGQVKINAGRARSMDLITAALFELLGERAFAEISITEICEKAGVARKTFYRNFDSKLSIVEKLVDRVFYEFLQKYDLKTSGARAIYKYWFEYILCAREFSVIFFDPDLYAFISRKIIEFVQIELSETLHNAAAFDPMLDGYYLNFVAAGIASIMREWMKNDCKTPVKTMVALTDKLIGNLLV